MLKFERILHQMCKNEKLKNLNIVSTSSRLFTTDKISTDTSQNHNNSQQGLHEKSLENQDISNESTNVSDLVKEFAKHTTFEKHVDLEPHAERSQSFASLLRHSNFMHMGDPEGKIVVGKIFEVINNDLYIDFGWKFHCVCPKPMKNNSDYVRGAKVRLRIKDLELSTRFLGSTKDVTLLEADCVLLGLVSTPNRINKTVVDTSNATTV